MKKDIDRIRKSPIRYLILLFVVTLGVAYALSGYVSPRAAQLASFFSGAVLSFLLLVVYLEIRSSEQIQANQIEQQTDILDNQQELQKSLRRLQHEAKVRVERIEANDDTAELWLSNYGSGTADSLELVTEVILPNDPDLEGREKPSKVHRIEEHPGASRSEILGTGASAIGGNERNVKFKSTPLLLGPHSANGQGSYILAYHQSIGMASDSESAEFQLYIQYSDELSEETDRIPVLQYRLRYNPATDHTLQDILTSGSPILE